MKRIVLILMLPTIVFSQTTDCSKNFKWVKKTFEENDSGFQFIIDKKGVEAYTSHNKIYYEKVKNLKILNECTPVLHEWLKFFRTGHISIQPVNQSQNQTNSQVKLDDSKIIEQFKDWEKIQIDTENFKKYSQSINQDGYEGIWDSPPYKIGIKKISGKLKGFIIEADGVYWRKGQVKLRIDENNKTATFYMRDHSAHEFRDIELIGNNNLQIGHILLQRDSPKNTTDKSISNYFKSINSQVPYIKKLSDKTIVLRIPTFIRSEKKSIDKVLEENTKLINATENLIIDIRNNGGGSDASYANILPLIYTNPIRIQGVEYLSTPLNNERMKGFITNPDFSKEDQKWAKDALDKLNKNIGSFISVNENSISIKEFKEIKPNPKNVAILINQVNGSTSEQFLLAAKQSTKVKLFGTTTMGILDISNMHSVTSPSNEFTLGYCLTKSSRIPEMAIDGKGIMPDFYLDKTIAKYQWIEFVKNTIEN